MEESHYILHILQIPSRRLARARLLGKILLVVTRRECDSNYDICILNKSIYVPRTITYTNLQLPSQSFGRLLSRSTPLVLRPPNHLSVEAASPAHSCAHRPCTAAKLIQSHYDTLNNLPARPEPEAQNTRAPCFLPNPIRRLGLLPRAPQLVLLAGPNLIVPQLKRPHPPIHALIHPARIAYLRAPLVAAPRRRPARPAIPALPPIVLSVLVRVSAYRLGVLRVDRDKRLRAPHAMLLLVQPARVAQRLVRARVAPPEGRRGRVAVRAHFAPVRPAHNARMRLRVGEMDLRGGGLSAVIIPRARAAGSVAPGIRGSVARSLRRGGVVGLL
jgi:hypothetical protein